VDPGTDDGGVPGPDPADPTLPPPDPGQGPLPTDPVDPTCLTLTADADPVVLPADIIFVIDTSGSMDDEAAALEANMNRFVDQVATDGSLDLRVVVVANDPGVRRGFETLLGICIPPPLGGEPNRCRPDTVTADGPDVDTERYLHVREIVFSREPLSKFVEHYPRFRDFLRPGVPTHIVMISDDRSFMSADEFRRRVGGLTPGFPQGYRLHSIVGERTRPRNNFLCREDERECTCRTAEAPGDAFIELTESTGGVFQSVCSTDWTAVYRAIADAVREDSRIPCQYDVPELGEFEEVNRDRVRVRYATGGVERELARVPGPAQCGEAAGQGWYFDSNVEPSIVHLCPDACGQDQGEVTITFECVKR
jgi:hypothetical protein